MGTDYSGTSNVANDALSETFLYRNNTSEISYREAALKLVKILKESYSIYEGKNWPAIKIFQRVLTDERLNKIFPDAKEDDLVFTCMITSGLLGFELRKIAKKNTDNVNSAGSNYAVA